jgi:type I restriction enzyme S subunit
MGQSITKTPLMNICNPKQWRTISQRDFTEDGYPVFGANGIIGFYNKFNHEMPTILVTCRGATCGKVNISAPFSYVTGNAMALDDLDERSANMKYLYHFFVWRGFNDVITGTAQPQITRKSLEAIEIPLPSLSEQERIAAILDKADGIRRKRQEAIVLASTFLRSVFLKMFGDPVTNPIKWKEVLLQDVASISSGVTKGKKYSELELVDVPYMRVANVQDGWIDTTDMKTITVSSTEVDRYSLKTGDLLLTEGGDPDKLGRGAVWDGSISPCIHQNHIFKVRFDTSLVLPEYASFLIGSIRGKRYFLCAAKQTTGIATINKTQLSNFKMLVPDMKLQQQFSDTVLRAKVTLKKLEQLADVSNYMFSSLQQRAFRGDL